MLEENLTFITVDPPRESWFASWSAENPGGLLQAETNEKTSTTIEVLVPAKRGTNKISVAAQRLELSDAIDQLANLAKSEKASPSAHAWASITRTALTFIAEGKVLPWVSPKKYDTWRLDPLEAHEMALVNELAKNLPAEAYALPVHGKGKISDPVFLIRNLFDAIADNFLRTAAATKVANLHLFADRQKTQVPQLRPWVNDLAVSHCASTQLILRVHPPEDDQDWHITFHLQSKSDPSLIIDAANFWKTPVKIMEHLGEQAEVTLLAGLRYLGKVVKPLENILEQANPTDAWLDDSVLDSLLDKIDDLAEQDIDVRWPSELVAPKVERQLVVSTTAPTGALPSVTNLQSLLKVNWEFLLAGTPLKADELQILSKAKRAVVELRGKWVRIDARLREQLTQRPPEISAIHALAAAMGADIEIGEENDPVTVKTEGSVAEIAQKLVDLSMNREQKEPPGLQAELRPYQRRGLAWMIDLCNLGLGGCLADDMGLGKTIQLLALHASRPGPTLVVCPTSLLSNWAREAKKFIPDTTVRTYHGSKRNLDEIGPNELVLTTYGVVRSDAQTLKNQHWDLVVADEAQHAKNPHSRTAKSLRQLEGNSRIALTGTPVENRLSELWSILDWTVPGLLGPLATFRRQMAIPIEKDNDAKASQQLNQLIQPFLLRRKKTDPGIAPELPPKLERDVTVPLTAEQITLYKATVDTALTEVAKTDGIKRRGLVLKLLTGLKQITNHPAQYLKQEAPLPGRSGKLDAVDELLAMARSNNESTLLFTQYVKMGKLLTSHIEKSGYKVEILHGSLSVNARQELVDRFQNKELDVLILSLKAGGTGLNLTSAAHVIHYDRWWNPAVEDQATDRAYRIGQKQTVTVHRIITQGTVEDRVAELLTIKRKLADRVIGSGEGWISDLSDDDLSELVQLEEV